MCCLRALAALIPVACTAPAAAQVADVTLSEIDTIRIADRSRDFTETSGLALAPDGRHYWAVSDDTTTLFLLTERGKLKPGQSLAIAVDGLEGLAPGPDANRFLAVREDTSEVVSIDLSDGSLTVHPLGDMDGFPGIADVFGPLRSNNGLEGVTYDPDRNEVLVVKEAHPRLLLRLSADLSTILGATGLTAADGFACAGTADANLDVSDILYDPTRKIVWLLSDTGACLQIADPATGKIIGRPKGKDADVPLRLPKNPEGLALNSTGTELRIVTDNDKDSRMMILSIE
jgi:uncharacterized protein YjiK